MRVHIGTAPAFAEVEPVTEHCIRKHASRPVEIVWMRPGERGLQANGCTGFTNFRYAIPSLCGYQGFSIYLDVDMFLYADVVELWEYRQPGKWVTLTDGADEVSVIDCSLKLPAAEDVCLRSKSNLKGQYAWRKHPAIPLEWNCQDCAPPGMKLLHFTDLTRQPWSHPGEHPLEGYWRRLKIDAGL